MLAISVDLGDLPVIDQVYQILTARTNRPILVNRSATKHQQPCNLGFARIVEQSVPSLFSRFREESWYHSRATKPSGEMRTRSLLHRSRSNDVLVKRYFPLLKRAANIYQSVSLGTLLSTRKSPSLCVRFRKRSRTSADESGYDTTGYI